MWENGLQNCFTELSWSGQLLVEHTRLIMHVGVSMQALPGE